MSKTGEDVSSTSGQFIHAELFGGLSGLNLDIETFDFGRGVILRKTYAHFMAPFLMAFTPAEPGQPHPAPWKPAGGGLAFDIVAEIYIPFPLRLSNFYNRLNTIWWLTALMRLRSCSLVRVPVISDMSFGAIKDNPTEPRLMPVEIESRRLPVVREPCRSVDLPTLEWVRDHWHSAGLLTHQSEEFNVAIQACDTCTWTRSLPLAIVEVWGALERLFSPARAELKFRVSANIAAFLEPAGDKRLSLFKRIQKLYDALSAAAHGAGQNAADAFFESWQLLRRVILKVIDDGRVPRREDLDGYLFGS